MRHGALRPASGEARSARSARASPHSCRGGARPAGQRPAGRRTLAVVSVPSPTVTIEEVLCDECLREASADVAEDEGWGVYADLLGRIHAVCVECSGDERLPPAG